MATNVKEEWIKTSSQVSNEAIDPIWWKMEGDKIAENLLPLVKSIEERQIYRRVKNIRNARLYSNLELMNYQTSIFNRMGHDYMTPNRVSLNVIRSCIDTAAAKIAKMKPRSYFLTSDGDWSQRQRAKQLTGYFEGLFQDTMPIYFEKQRSFTDGAVFGTGAVKIYWDSDKKAPTAERVVIDEIIVDDAEGIYGRPLQLHQTRYLNRYALIEKWPDNTADILSVAGAPSDMPKTPGATDLIKVVESWKLPSSKNAMDGKHVICIENKTLFEEQWRKDYFPFIFDRWIESLMGFYGTSLSEDLTGIQLELNKLLRSIQMAQHFMSVPRVFVDNGSSVNLGHINTTFGGIVKFTGSPPIFNTAPAMPAEVYQHVESLYRKAFEIAGISQLSAQSMKPAGLNSGKALREYQDIESERFELVGKRYEETFIDATRMCIDLLDEHGKRLPVSIQDGKSQRKIEWEDVRMDMEDYVLRVFPSSIFPSQPAAKLQTVQEFVQAGFIEKDMALSLLDFPDLDGAMNLKTSAYELVQKQMELMLGRGESVTPEPFQDLGLAMNIGQMAYMEALSDGAPEDRLELVRTYLEDAKTLQQRMAEDAMMKQQAAMAQAMPQGPQSPGMGVPAAPPVSDMLPVGA